MAKDNILDITNKIYGNLKGWKFARDSITEYFDNNKQNINEKAVLIKVLLVDALYKTNLKKPVSVAKHICFLKELDKKIKEGDLSAVEEVRKWNIDILSFASKFCHFHNKEAYPIYDKYVCKALKDITKYKDKRDYDDFNKNVHRVKVKLNATNLEEIDTFLWLYGQKLRLKEINEKSKKRDVNLEISDFYDKNKPLFDSLKISV